MSFAEKMRTTSTEKKAEIEAMIAEKVAARKAKQEERAAEVRDELFAKSHGQVPRHHQARHQQRCAQREAGEVHQLRS